MTASSIVEVDVLGVGKTAFFSPERVRIGVGPDVEVPLPAGGGGVLLELRRTAQGYLLLGLERHRVLASGMTLEVNAGSLRLVLRIGLTIPFGRHLLTGALSEGGMAQVFTARLLGPRDLVFGERAIKLIRPEVRGYSQIEEMFLDEARILSEIRHPNVVPVFDIGAEEGLLFLAMELVRGITLRRLLQQFRERGTPLPAELAAALVSQACRGLHAAHEVCDSAHMPMRVVHRDVSPQNLLVSTDGIVQVIDFGVARAEGRLQRSALGQFKGKPAYAAPEQVQGLSVDHRVDVFAAAVVLYELCTGHHPFSRATDYATLFAVVSDQPPEPRTLCREIPKELGALVLQALAKDPEDRPQTAAEFANSLDGFLQKQRSPFLRTDGIVTYLREQGYTLDDLAPTPLMGRPAVLRPPGVPPPPPPPPPPPVVVSPTVRLTPPPPPGGAPTQRLPPRHSLVVPATPQTLALPFADTDWSELSPGVNLCSVVLSQEMGQSLRVLPFDQIRGLLPASLHVQRDPSSPAALVLEVAPQDIGRRGGDRPGLYLNAAEPATRQAGYLINGDIEEGHLDVGHRRLGVRRLGLCCRCAPAADAAPLQVKIASLALTLTAQARLLVALYCSLSTTEPISHIVCVLVR